MRVRGSRAGPVSPDFGKAMSYPEAGIKVSTGFKGLLLNLTCGHDRMVGGVGGGANAPLGPEEICHMVVLLWGGWFRWPCCYSRL